ncbi:MAG: branched-chain amino acid ABC transporter permease [Bacteroidetes bacterium]|nr:MAG: branched-chain amino acid ABC transporter permease [Bacteroidota bacterium]
MEYILHILILIGIYIILTMSLNLLAGYTGILSIAHAAFYGLGAYVAALMALQVHTPFLVNLVLAIVAATVLGAFIGIPTLRIKDDYFVIATFAFQVITFSVLNNWVSFTGGPMGLPGIPQPNILGLSITEHYQFLILVVVLCAVTFFICVRVVKSPFGRVLKAIREDEILAQSLGKNVSLFKVKVFMLSAGLASISGVLYATFITYIDPTSFTVMESIFIISIVIIGGTGNLWGSVLGAVVLVSLPELLRFVGLPSSIAANIRQILYGVMLVIFMIWRPQGFIGEFSFRK